jgi:predicted PurR-regulated permease PerM
VEGAAVDKTTLLVAVAACAGLGYVVYLLSPILTPFVLSALLAYVCDPLVDRMEARKLPRTVAVVVLFVLLSLALLVLVLVIAPLMQKQLATLAAKLPAYIDALQHNVVPWLRDTLGIDTAAVDLAMVKQRVLEHWRDVGGWLAASVTYITHSGMTLVLWLTNLVLVPVVTFYLLRDWDRIVASVRDLLPARYRLTVVGLAREIDDVLASFLRGQLSVMLALAVIYSVGLWLVGLDLALLIGLLAGLVSFVPYLGFIVGILAAGIAALLQYQALTPLLWVLAVFGVGQVLEGSVLTPRLVGERVGLHPVAVIFAVMAGGQLFGFFGILLALPVAAALMVWVRHLHGRYRESALYRDQGPA